MVPPLLTVAVWLLFALPMLTTGIYGAPGAVTVPELMTEIRPLALDGLLRAVAGVDADAARIDRATIIDRNIAATGGKRVHAALRGSDRRRGLQRSADTAHAIVVEIDAGPGDRLDGRRIVENHVAVDSRIERPVVASGNAGRCAASLEEIVTGGDRALLRRDRDRAGGRRAAGATLALIPVPPERITSPEPVEIEMFPPVGLLAVMAARP